MSTETTTVTIGEATTVTVSANTGPRGPAGADGNSSGVTDGDKGDITVSGSGAVWTIDNNSVTLAKLADIATASILGRTTAATGDPEALTATQVRALLNVEDGATADQSAAEILTAIKTVDGATSGLDADLLDGNEASAFATAAQGTLADSAYQPGDTIPITDGGTGAQSAAVARTNLDVYSTTETDTAISNATSPLLSTAAAPELIRDTMGTALVAGSNVTITPNDGADTITIAATAAGGASLWRTGYHYRPLHLISGSGAHTLNRLYCLPLWVPTAGASIDQANVRVVTGAASSVLRLGVYADDGSGYPDALLQEFGTIDSSTAAASKTLAISPSLALTASLVWLAIVCQGGTPTLMNGSANSNQLQPLPVSGAVDTQSTSWYQDSVSGALPATFTGTALTTGSVPVFGVRKA